MIPKPRLTNLAAITVLLSSFVTPALYAVDTYEPFPALVERSVGTTAKSVRFDWRKRQQVLTLSGGQPVEYNNFESKRLSANLFLPDADINWHLGLARVSVSSTASSRDLENMPYRQLGRPSRWELEGGLFVPMAEGVVTFRPSFFTAAQMVFSLSGDIRYFIYPSTLGDEGFLTTLKNSLSFTLTKSELRILRKEAPGGMRIDPARLAVLGGCMLQLYTLDGFLLSTKAMLAIPYLGTEMPLHADYSVGLGYAF